MDDYFSEDNAVKFDQKNGTIDTLCFCRDKYLAEEIAKAKMNDLNAFDIKEATKIICGSARSMGIEVKE